MPRRILAVKERQLFPRCRDGPSVFAAPSSILFRPEHSHLALAVVLLSGVMFYAACGGDGAVTTTEPPPPPPPPSTTVASVEVTAAIDTLIALGRTAQLNVTVRDADGNALTDRTVTWTSSDQAMATVNTSGLVTSVAAGAVTITATSEGVAGSLPMRMVAADLDGIGDLLEDPYVLRLVANVDQATATRLGDAFSEVSSGIDNGNLSAIGRALTTAQGEVASSTDADDVVLFALLRLVLDYAERLLNL